MSKELNHKKARLGRGLNSLLGNVESFEESATKREPFNLDKENSAQFNSKEKSKTLGLLKVWNLPIEKIVPNKNQPRKHFAKEELQSLADSIKEKGILQPVTVREISEDQFEIIAGERRWRAAQIAGSHEVPALIKVTTEKSAMEFALIENIQREDLNPIEEAKAYQFLMSRYQMTQKELSKKVGKDRVTIANMLRLLSLSASVQKMLLQSEISLGQAKLLVSVVNPDLQKIIADKASHGKLTVRGTESLVRKSLNPTRQKNDLSSDETKASASLVRALCEEMQKSLGTKVEVVYKAGRGQVQIHFHSDEELNALAERF